MSNPWKDYLQNFRDNLPTSVAYREDIARYVFNDKRFILPNDVVRYKNYLEKLGFVAFTPATLFASGEQGAWYDPSDLSTMFTDTDGTTPATVGDPVARINDKSGRGNHATQATAAARPTLQQTAGGLYYLEFDGVDDFLALPLAVSGGATELDAFQAISTSDVTKTVFCPAYAVTSSIFAYLGGFFNSDVFIRVGLGNLSAGTLTTPVTNNTTYVVSALIDATAPSLAGRVNGAEIGSVTNLGGGGELSPTTQLFYGARNSSGTADTFGPLKSYGLILRQATSTTTEISGTEAYLADKSGVTP